MSDNQYLRSYPGSASNSVAMHYQTANPYAALLATAGPEHDRQSASSGTPPSSGSSASLFGFNDGVSLSATPHRSQANRHSSFQAPQEQAYKPSKQISTPGPRVNNTSTSFGDNTSAMYPVSDRSTTQASISSKSYTSSMRHDHWVAQASSLSGVPQSVTVQETAFRQGQRDSSSAHTEALANPFDRQFDQLWKAFYKLGKECGGQRVVTPVNHSQKNFAWPVLINPYTQSLRNPNGSLDPAWSRKMITAALSCMEELVRITCRRNSGWDKTVADIPLPAQEALVAFPDLAQRYEQLKRDAKEARAGGRPYGY